MGLRSVRDLPRPKEMMLSSWAAPSPEGLHFKRCLSAEAAHCTPQNPEILKP